MTAQTTASIEKRIVARVGGVYICPRVDRPKARASVMPTITMRCQFSCTAVNG